MTKLLSSVRDLSEAKIAVTAGSDWLDLKEPRDGALGAVGTNEIRRIVNWASQTGVSQPLSATIGDCWDQPQAIRSRVNTMAELGVQFIKIGLFIDRLDTSTLEAIKSVIAQNIIIVCLVEKPLAEASISKLVDSGVRGLMLDTAEKSSGSLTEKLSFGQIADFVNTAKDYGVLCGLAGSLQASDIEYLAPLGPDYLGFRGALCESSRAGMLCAQRVANIKSNIQEHRCGPRARVADLNSVTSAP